jgi:hypothetical protein
LSIRQEQKSARWCEREDNLQLNGSIHPPDNTGDLQVDFSAWLNSLPRATGNATRIARARQARNIRRPVPPASAGNLQARLLVSLSCGRCHTIMAILSST